MNNGNNLLKRVFAWTVLVSVCVCGLVVYLHFAAEHRQAQREVIYLKARQMAAEEQRQRVQEYQKRLQEQRLRERYQQGRVAGRGN